MEFEKSDYYYLVFNQNFLPQHTEHNPIARDARLKLLEESQLFVKNYHRIISKVNIAQKKKSIIKSQRGVGNPLGIYLRQNGSY